MSNIPGLEHLAKEGWEIVGFDNVSQDDWFIDSEGRVVPWGFSRYSDEKKISYLHQEWVSGNRPAIDAWRDHRQ